jgi:hypothetical protein
MLAARPKPLKGRTQPSIAPPPPARSRLKAFQAIATELGIKPYPWQTLAARHLMALGPHGWLKPEVCIVVARQNGKTELLLPRIIDDLRRGRRIIHTAQNRTLPRSVFLRVAAWARTEPTVRSIRYANGQEAIELANGGRYIIVAPQRGSRGQSADTLIFDELREFEDFDIMAAATPTLTASTDPQTIFLSNAGSLASVVLNDLKRRGEDGGDEMLTYLEWSADGTRSVEDVAGWSEANPSMGHNPNLLRYLEKQHLSLPVPEFETEHLCRWVKSDRVGIVSEALWRSRQDPELGEAVRPVMGIAYDPSGRRASAVIAWQREGGVGVRVVADVHGDPIDLDRFGPELEAQARKLGVRRIAFASWTDGDLARYLKRAKPLDGKEYATASESFTRLVETGFVAWDGPEQIADDLAWAARKPHESGAWQAVKATDDRPITAVLAAIRAVWLASAPRVLPRVG